MGAPKHTRGPWVADEVDGFWGVFADSDGDGVAMLWESASVPLRPNEAEANARLIAAAPDLLEAVNPDLLERVADLLQEKGLAASASALRECAHNQRAAIRKATEAGQ